ncbi:MAG TPA: hypothetical protein VGD00_01990, partial [Solirubrobacteraceae bacterium]
APTTYAVKTQLYLGAASEGQALLNNTLGKTKQSSTTIANQAQLINSTIGEIVKKKFRAEHNHDAVKGKVKAKPTASSEFIQLTGEARTPKAASEVTNAYAQAYVKRHQANYERAVGLAIATTKAQIARIERAAAVAKARAGGKNTNSSASTLQTAALQTKLNQLENDLTVKGVQQVGIARPGKAELLGPKPKQNAIFGFVIGIVLASIAVFLAAQVNRRVRSLADVESIFGLPVLAAVPQSRAPIVRREGRIRPSKLLSEPLWRLHSSIHLGVQGEGSPHGHAPKSILFLSADPGDGKSTIAAGLALVQRDAGERTMLVEADFRRPTQARLLDLGAQNGHGLAEVLAGSALPSAAMERVRSHEAAVNGAAAAGAGASGPAVATAIAPRGGSVNVLRGRPQVANPPALLGRPEMTELLRTLGRDFDNVLVDAPPLLQVSDVMPLLGSVDGIVIVARIDHTRESSARRLMQLLARTPSAPVLGVVANAVRRRDIQRYGFSSGTGQRAWPLSMLGR